MTDQQILSCPFCCTTNVSTSYACNMQNEITQRFVECEECAAMGPSADTDAEAIELWNRRGVAA